MTKTLTPYEMAELDGVKFHWRKLRGPGGQRYQVTHHDGRDMPTIQHLGQENGTWSIEAVFHDTVNGAGWRAELTQFLEVIARGGAQRFYDPALQQTKLVLVESNPYELDGLTTGEIVVPITLINADTNRYQAPALTGQFAAKFDLIGATLKLAFLARVVLASDDTNTSDATNLDLIARTADLATSLDQIQIDANVSGDGGAAWGRVTTDLGTASALNGGFLAALPDLFSAIPPGLADSMLNWGQTAAETFDGLGLSQASVQLLDSTRRGNHRAWPPLDTWNGRTQIAIQRNNRTALTLAVRTAALLGGMNARMSANFVDQTAALQALSITNQAVKAITVGYSQMEGHLTAEVAALKALRDLNRDFMGHIRSVHGTLPQQKTRTLPRVMPALAAMHYLSGSTDQAAEMLAMNKVRHPGFVQRHVDVLQRTRRLGQAWD